MNARILLFAFLLAVLAAGPGCANNQQVVDEHHKSLTQEEEG